MASKGKKSVAVEIPECPICLDTMTIPVFLCQSGHSLCNSCTLALCPPSCPICRQPMTQMRNRSLEELINKAKSPCPNQSAGCVFSLPGPAMADHLKECLFRPRECPHAVFGRCSWNGDVRKMMEHFKEKHPAHCVAEVDREAGWRLQVEQLDLKECARHVFLAAQQNFLFIITLKVDTIQRMAYWVIQHIGQKKIAQQHLYEIQVTSGRDQQRKVVFTEHCLNDSLKADEVFRQANCAVMPLDMLTHFIKDKTLSFRFVIKRLNRDNKENVQAPSSRESSVSRGRDASQGPETRGPGPKPHWKKHPGQKPGPKKFTKAQA
ncbi:E3 ubiquitin-protein ligase SIAH1-like [Cydia fagiglandana]|uniref:E3 ubiquitin-protein ligase SIAH1-like n=1 Tax=Cydia fagiglandana TaxID=1458189 RepID=UPI002FEDE594